MESRNLLLKHGTLVSGGRSFISDILISDGKIERIAEGIVPDEDTEVLDVTGYIVS